MHKQDSEKTCPANGLQIRLMGVPEVSLNGVPLTFSRRRALALLVYLAVTGHVHTRDVLATMLSGEASESQARKRLSNALAELRQLVGDYVITTRDTAAFNSNLPWWTDVWAFRTMLTRGMESDGLDELQDAADLFHEEFVSGLTVSEAAGFDEWVMLQGEALRTQAVQVLQTIVARAIRTRADTDGIAAARRLVSLEPWLDEAHRQLMTLLARVGQRQEAVAQFEVCRSILLEELGEEPSPETIALYNRLRTPHIAVPSGLPSSSTALVGRDAELHMLRVELDDPDCRLITLAGLAGSGKTQLALTCARTMVEATSHADQEFPDGVFFVPLADIPRAVDAGPDTTAKSARDIAAAIIATLGSDPQEVVDPTECLKAMVASKTLLLLLDGVHDIPSAALHDIIELLNSCAHITTLVTSREPLRHPTEHVLQVGGLGLPENVDDVELAPASRMLLLEAQRVRVGYVVHDEDRPHIVTLCRLVGGLPLALSLLARWLPKLEPADMVLELEQNLESLTTTDPRVAEGHRSIRSLMAHTWEQLSEEERRVLRGLSVFQEGCDSPAIRAVLDCSMKQVSQFIDAGFVSQGKNGRYVLHELIRQLANGELTARPEEAAKTQRQYATYYAHLVADLTSDVGQSREAIQTLTHELDNIRASWILASNHRYWHLLDVMNDGIFTYFSITGLFQEGTDLIDGAIQALRAALLETDGREPALETLLERMLIEQTDILITRSQLDRAEHALLEIASINGTPRSPWLQASLEYYWGLLCASRFRYSDAQTHIERALVVARDAGLHRRQRDSLLLMSQLTYIQGSADCALDQIHQVIASCRAWGDTAGEIRGLIQLGIMAVEHDDCGQGRLALEHARRLMDETYDTPMAESALLSAFGLLETATGHYGEAEQHHACALHLNRQMGWRDTVAVQFIMGESGSLRCLGRLARIGGDSVTARLHLCAALHICQDVGSQLGEAMTLVEMSLLEHVEGDGDRARQLAYQAINIVQRSEHRQLRRSALAALGHAEYDLGHLTEAAAAYANALVLDRELGNRWRVIESTTDLARVALTKGDRVRASALLAPVLHDVLAGSPSTIDDPARAYAITYEILHSIGDPREAALLPSGLPLAWQRADGTPDDTDRFLGTKRLAPQRDLLHAGNGNGFHTEAAAHSNGHGGM